MSYLRFDVLGTSPSGKTLRVQVTSANPNVQIDATKHVLGWISWYAPWRRYCFAPAAGTVFDVACLGEIREQIGRMMDEKKKT